MSSLAQLRNEHAELVRGYLLYVLAAVDDLATLPIPDADNR